MSESQDRVGSPPAGAASKATPTQPEPENAASEAPTSKPKSRRGGRRRGAGRPPVFVQMERADAAAEAAIERLRTDVDPEEALQRVLNYHVEQLELQLARGKFGSPDKTREHARAIVATARELLPFQKPKLAAVAMQQQVEVVTVVRAPEICKTTPEWIEKYGRPAIEQQRAIEPPVPHVQEILDGVQAEADRREKEEYDRRLADWEIQNPQPPRRSPVSEDPPSMIPAEFWRRN
jgi:hypothetical protein